MSRRGHLQKVRRPTNLEVYNDAAKILEELLEKRIDGGVKAQNRQKRNKTDPTTDRILESLNTVENPVARSKTMPSKYRESPNDDARKKELESILINKGHEKIHEQAGNGFVSSADSEGEEENSMKKRKKKSLFKLAKERLIHTFNRDQKEGFGKMKKDVDESPNRRRRKPKKKPEKGELVSESSRRIKARLNVDNSVDYTEEVEYRNKSESIHTDVHCRNSRSSSFSRNALINTIKRPFRKFDRQESKSDEVRKSKCISSKDMERHPSSSPLPSTAPQSSETRPQELHLGDLPSPGGRQTSSSSKSPSPTKYDDHTFTEVGNPHPLSSSSSALPVSEHNSLGSLNLLPSIRSNVLDSPGEDIEYMDVDVDQTRSSRGDNRTRSIHSTGIKFHTSEGLLNFNWLADQTADRAKTMDYEIDEHSVSKLRPDGDMEMTTTLTATRTVVMPEVREVDEHDHVDGDELDKPVNKEELYGKIAQKLIAMADTYGASMSDPETTGATAPSDAPLTDLEKEIIACLRSKDKYSRELEDKLKEVTTNTVDDAYRRFHSTIQNSLGTELTWNHLAFVFYSTKGVVSALGKGSQAANQAKDFTLQYISDTFASWIMDQGGFDSMLSSSESDPEVD